jgi:tRNA threonylcarbamoyl adenosine modification protein YeaZ
VLLLAIDTSSAAVTAAVHDGSDILAVATELGAQAHGELLAPTIAHVLAASHVPVGALTDIVVGVGPGPFTGLRVGIVTARVMAETLGVALHGACSLDALAHEAVSAGFVSGAFGVATDARRKEVYLAAYDHAGARDAEPRVLRPADVDVAFASSPVVGAGAWLYPEVFADPREPRLVSAGWLASYAVARLGAGQALRDTTPLYLRRPDAVESAGRKRVTQP